MTLNDFFDRIMALRQCVNKAVTYMREVKHEPGKLFEGEWEITLRYPDWDEDEKGILQPNWCEIKLYCYLIGPSRNYEWRGTLEEALARCTEEVQMWCKEVYEDDAE